jgi:hypothetical protein
MGMVIVGGVGYGLGREPQSESLSAVSVPQAATVPEPVCADVVERADAALRLGAQLDASLSQQSSVLDDLLSERSTRQQVVGTVPPLAVLTAERQAFLDAVRDYEQARAGCPGLRD